MNDLGTLCAFIAFILVAMFVLPRLMNNFQRPVDRGTDNYPRGDEYPRHDDPNIRSSGRFGGGSRSSTNLPEWIRRRASRGQSAPARRTDSPNIRSRGSFGRSKE